MSAFDAALDELLAQEGGYVNNPKDPGGPTNLGVTQHVWEQWTGKPATEADMRALQRADVAPLYQRQYWEATRCDALPAALGLCVFDFAVNAGPARAARYVQQIVHTAMDGEIGPATLAAVNARPAARLVRDYQNARRGYYRQLPTFPTFGKGWLRRCDEVETAALRLA
jgi:lysozyme family protein